MTIQAYKRDRFGLSDVATDYKVSTKGLRTLWVNRSNGRSWRVEFDYGDDGIYIYNVGTKKEVDIIFHKVINLYKDDISWGGLKDFSGWKTRTLSIKSHCK